MPTYDRNIPSLPARPRTMILIGFWVIMLLVFLWTGYYTVPAESEGVVLRFGRFSHIVPSGLHFKLPLGIDIALIRIKGIPDERNLSEEEKTIVPVVLGDSDRVQPGVRQDLSSRGVDRVLHRGLTVEPGVQRLLHQQLALDHFLERRPGAGGARVAQLAHRDLGAVHLGGELRGATLRRGAFAPGGQHHRQAKQRELGGLGQR